MFGRLLVDLTVFMLIRASWGRHWLICGESESLSFFWGGGGSFLILYDGALNHKGILRTSGHYNKSCPLKSRNAGLIKCAVVSLTVTSSVWIIPNQHDLFISFPPLSIHSIFEKFILRTWKSAQYCGWRGLMYV